MHKYVYLHMCVCACVCVLVFVFACVCVFPNLQKNVGLVKFVTKLKVLFDSFKSKDSFYDIVH